MLHCRHEDVILTKYVVSMFIKLTHYPVDISVFCVQDLLPLSYMKKVRH